MSENPRETLNAAQVAALLDTALVGMGAMKMLRDLLPEAAQLVETSSLDLSVRFRELANGAHTQSETIEELLSTAGVLELEGRTITLDDFIRLFNDTLQEAVGKILFVSKKAMSMVYCLDDAIDHLRDLESFLATVKTVTRQTNILAINAKIEAAQAGDAGSGFAVVADEVRAISKTIESLSLEMQRRIEGIGSSVRTGYEMLQEVATTDMTDNIAARDTLNHLLQGMVRQGDRLHATMRESAESSRQISGAIGSMVVGMQFQDRTSQIIANAVGLLDRHLEQLKQTSDALAPHHTPGDAAATAAQTLLNCLTLGDIRSRLKESLEQLRIACGAPNDSASGAVDAGEVELF